MAQQAEPRQTVTETESWRDRATLTGDWGGVRTELQEKGFTIEFSPLSILSGAGVWRRRQRLEVWWETGPATPDRSRQAWVLGGGIFYHQGRV